MTKVVLGKGLEALIPGSKESSEQDRYRHVALDKIAPNPMQPRSEFDGERLSELAESLRNNGVLQPLLVKRSGQTYIIVAGERRYRAARMAELTEVPVVVIDEVDNTRMLELALIENIHRQDLNPIETALAYRKLIDDCSLTQNDLAQRVGKSRAAITNQLRLLSLPEKIQQMLRAGQLTEGHARAVLALDGEDKMLQMAEQIISGSLSVRETESRTSRKKRGRRAVRRNSPAVAEMENNLKQILSTSVKIVPGGRKGRIEIEFYGDDDLGRLWELFLSIRH